MPDSFPISENLATWVTSRRTSRVSARAAAFARRPDGDTPPDTDATVPPDRSGSATS